MTSCQITEGSSGTEPPHSREECRSSGMSSSGLFGLWNSLTTQTRKGTESDWPTLTDEVGFDLEDPDSSSQSMFRITAPYSSEGHSLIRQSRRHAPKISDRRLAGTNWTMLPRSLLLDGAA